MSDTTRRTYHVHAVAVPDAVERAKATARLEGFVVVTVARVALADPGWDVTLILRTKSAA